MNNELRTMNYGEDNELKKVLLRCSRFIVHNSIPGFTLIELLVVISILGVLATLLISNVSGVRERARDSQRKSDLYEIKQSLKMYHNDFDDYPAIGDGGKIKGCGTTAAPADCSWGGEFKKNDTVYMKYLPEDPSSTDYIYSRIDFDNFTLYATLENKSDSDITTSQGKCGINGQGTTTKYYICAD